MKVLITGGAGYIGATIVSCCLDAGIVPIILDDLSTGSREFAQRFNFYEGDIANRDLIDRIFDDHPDIEAVVHCAAKIVVTESVKSPLDYYDNNVAKSITLVRKIADRGIRRFILSSTAAMYASTNGELVDEDAAVAPTNPYAASKWMLEQVLMDFAATGEMDTISLRYFNPIGADPRLRSGLVTPEPTHALGKLLQAHREGAAFRVTGTGWPTRDGSGLRDYIHVWDLARAHVAALEEFDKITADQARNYEVINLGTGVGTTVFELVRAFELVTGQRVEVVTGPARPGDVAGCVPATGKAQRLLGWRVTLDVAAGINDSLRWAARQRLTSAEPQGL